MTTNASPTPARSLRPWAVLVAAVALVALVVGVWLMVRPTPGASFGWFAYAPMSETVYTAGRGSTDLVGLVLVVVGALGLGALGGYALGRRRRPV